MCRRPFRVAVGRAGVAAISRFHQPSSAGILQSSVSSYQVIARKWRPQRFDDVIGQRGVTQTLRNAIAVGRIAQSFVFAGPRGVGKTTTARILARCLNCEKGPTGDPCGECDACREIAQGRDMDVLEIDAATHTGVDKVRDVIIAGLGTAPARNRYKIFLIDEVHRLSQSAFDALLKSIEEPPPHVVFMMATTEIDKVPATIQSRSQVFELKTIGVKAIADQLRRIADAEGITVDDAALMLVARAGDGSMRDAQSAFDQVIAFAGTTIAAEDVGTVLGLVRRDLLLDVADAVAREDPAATFELAAQAVESGYDLRLVIRELARLTRDLLVVGIDPSRVDDPEIGADGERERLRTLAARFSAEDLMRAFDVLTKAEVGDPGVDAAALSPRDGAAAVDSPAQAGAAVGAHRGPGRAARAGCRGASAPAARPPLPEPRSAPPAGPRAAGPPSTITATLKALEARREQARAAPSRPGEHCRAARGTPAPPAAAPAGSPIRPRSRTAFLAEVQRAKKFFYGTVIAQAQRIDVEPDRIVIVFAPHHKALRIQLDPVRAALEEIAAHLAGRRMAVVAVESAAASPSPDAPTPAEPDRQSQLRQQALSDKSVQAMLDVFGTEIKDVEER